jgi:hypothetical protein
MKNIYMVVSTRQCGKRRKMTIRKTKEKGKEYARDEVRM